MAALVAAAPRRNAVQGMSRLCTARAAWTTEAGGEGGEQAHEQHHLYVGASHALVCW